MRKIRTSWGKVDSRAAGVVLWMRVFDILYKEGYAMQARNGVTLWRVTTVCRRDHLKAFVEIRRLRNEIRRYAPMNVELQIKEWKTPDTPIRHLSLIAHGEQSENADAMGRVARTLENLKQQAERTARRMKIG